MSIPIENIYFLLCYAWNKLEDKDKISVSIDGQTQLLDLFASILIKGTRVLLKRGIDKSYIETTAEVAGIKGKLNLSETLKSNLRAKQKTYCRFDEFSANITTNQIVVSTISRLIRIKGLDKGLKSELIFLLKLFSDIDLVDLTSEQFKRVRLNRNNRFYGFLLNVCEIIVENILPSDERGTYLFSDFIRDDQKMGQLFEGFVRNYLRIEQRKYPVIRREIIEWNFTSTSLENKRYLPQMQTDITLENHNEKIIIDAKYYRETMAVNYDREKIHSTNLYQLFSYLINQETETSPKTLTAKGILLYPTTTIDYDLFFSFKSHPIEVRTVNLNQSWQNISKRLISLIDRNQPDGAI